jgi:hypothetical protein
MGIPSTTRDHVFQGDGSALRSYLVGLPSGSYYTYCLLRPSNEPFYVGKGTGQRVLQHRLEALRSSLAPKSNPFKCNTIRAIVGQGQDIFYRIDRVFPPEDQYKCLIREEELIALYRRRCDGGILTNLAAGLGSLSAPDAFSLERHTATLAGVSEERPERTALNLFLRALGGVDSVPVKPLSEYRGRLVKGYASPKNLLTLSRRNGLTIVASALASGLTLAPGVEIPRCFDYVPDLDDWPLKVPPPAVVTSVIENGALSDVLKLGLVDLIPADRPEDERLRLSAQQIARLIGILGRDALQGWGLLAA